MVIDPRDKVVVGTVEDDDGVLVGRADCDVISVDAILAMTEAEELAIGAFDEEAAVEVGAFDDESAGEVGKLTIGAFDEAAGVVELPTTTY